MANGAPFLNALIRQTPRAPRARAMLNFRRVPTRYERRDIMPYLLGWLLGVPVIVLVILYLIFH